MISPYYSCNHRVAAENEEVPVIDASIASDNADMQMSGTVDPKTIYRNLLIKHCIKLKEKYVLSHATYTNIMDDTIGLFTSIQTDIQHALEKKNISDY